MTHTNHQGRFPLSLWILTVALTLSMLMTGCGSETRVTESTTAGTTTAATTATNASTATTTATPTAATAATTASTTSGTRPLSGPQAENSQLVLRSGETKVVTGSTADTELAFVWVELENRTDTVFTVSSVLSVTMADSGTGNPSLAPNVPVVLSKLASFDPDAATLDGGLAARGRISGWVYGAFPTGLAGIRIWVVLDGPNGTKTEPLSLDLMIR